MKYKTIGAGLGRNERNDINTNFENIDADIKSLILSNSSNSTAVAQALTDAANAKSTADAAKVSAEGISATASEAKTESVAAVATANEAKTTAETVRDQFDSVVAEAGSNNPEVVQARGTYTNLNQRLDSTAQQLAEKANQSFAEGIDKRVNNIVIPLSPENANIEVTDSHVSVTKNKTFPTLTNRIEDIEKDVKSNDFSVRNVINNGNFSNGTTNWIMQWDGAFTAVNNALIVTNKGTGFNPSIAQQTVHTIVPGHKVLIKAKVTVTNSDVLFLKVRVDGGSSAHVELINVSYPVKDNVCEINKIIELPTTLSGNLRLRIEATYPSAVVANGKSFEVRNVLIADLTDAFGTGQEPTIAKVDELLVTYPNGWFDGSINIVNVKKLFQTQQAIQSVGKRERKHKVLMVDINGLYLNGYDMVFPSEAFGSGYLVEVASYEAFVANRRDWKQDYDAIILNTQNEIMPDSTITPLQVKNAVQEYMANGVKLLLYAGDAFLFIRKYNLDGTHTQESLSSLLSNMGSRPAQNFSARTGVFRHGASYPFGSEILRTETIPSNGWTVDMSSTDTNVVYPVQAHDAGLGITANVVAYKPESFAVILNGGNTGTATEKIPYWKYVKSDIILDSLLRKSNKTRLAIDSVNGRQVAAFGVDCDVTNDLEAIGNLRDAFPSDVPIEWGMVSSQVNEEIAGFYRGLNGFNRYVSHTHTHYLKRLTVVDEIHTIPTGQIITLRKPYKAEISSLKSADGLTTFTKKAGTIMKTAPTASQYLINQVPDVSSANQLYDGKIKFDLSDVGKQVKISYSYTDENAEALGSLDTLRNFGVLTSPCVYTTMGSHSIHHSTYLRAEEEGAIISEFKSFPSYTRIWNALIPTHKNMTLPLGVTAKNSWTGTMVDSEWFKLSKAEAKALVQAAIARNKAFEMPIVFYTHDFYISRVASNGVWRDETDAKNPEWKKPTYTETLNFIKEMYTWMLEELKATEPYWMVRSEYERRYAFLNKHIVYDVQDNVIKVKNEGKEAVKGLTFRVPSSGAPKEIKLSNGSNVYHTHADGLTTVWFDMLPGEIAVEIR